MGIVMQSMWARRVSGGLNGREVTILNPWLGWRIPIQNNGEGENPKLSPTVKFFGDIRADVSGGEVIAFVCLQAPLHSVSRCAAV